jgi:hypothetical protein
MPAGVRIKGVMVVKLAVLRHEEGVRLEAERLLAIYAELGDMRGDHVVGRAIEEMAVQIADMQRYAEEPQGGDTGEEAMVLAAGALIRVARRIGLTTVARVAQDAIIAARAGDRTAQAAILARLMRIGDRSLNAIWDLQDLTLAPR